MAYLVTGGTGFLGSYIVRDLIRSGEDVVAYDYLPSNILNNVLTKDELNKVKIVTGDITDLIKIGHVIKENNIKKIIHLASLLLPDSNDVPWQAVQVNIGGQVTILEAARLWGIEKVVWASSVSVFGDYKSQPVIPVPNDANHYPNTVYAAAKSFNEYLAKHYYDYWGVDTLGLRYTLIYGPGRVRGTSCFVNSIVVNPVLGKPVVIENGDDIIDWQYVEDAARLAIKCSKVGPTKTRVFNTRCDVRSVKEAGDFVKTLIPKADISYKPGFFGAAWNTDDSRLQEEIGFKPEYTLEKGLKKMMNYVCQENNLPLFD